MGWQMSTGQSAVMLCGWGVKAGMVHSRGVRPPNSHDATLPPSVPSHPLHFSWGSGNITLEKFWEIKMLVSEF